MDSALHTVDSERSLTDLQFRSLFSDCPVAVHEIDVCGVLVRVNEAECNLLGYRAAELVGRPVWQLIAPLQRESSRRAILRKVSGRQPLVPFERQYVHRSGRLLTLQVHDTCLRSDAGARIGMRSVLLDVTERQELSARLMEQAAELARAKAELEKFSILSRSPAGPGWTARLGSA